MHNLKSFRNQQTSSITEEHTCHEIEFRTVCGVAFDLISHKVCTCLLQFNGNAEVVIDFVFETRRRNYFSQGSD